MNKLRLPKDKYLKVANASIVSMGTAYIVGHDFTVDGFMRAYAAFIDSLAENGVPGPVANIAIDVSIRYADMIQLAGNRAHQMMVNCSACPSCVVGV